ncbi:hypothetical protein CNMCM8927_006598 [Aspergillus lentulus]|uniref:Zn(2)-C6 fungal-type domain-containing protein n=1 Tax=Aspergillus lentulus TaxID=293939 RepID=A0AAN6BP60_ASPLE|nr:hypothetical protein CNMCM8060_009465 [Aspergillus lentulus]KAF4189594.1 hypothetical protein CNMCM7927_007278 [Aspergillus lentulus]KAF4198577.1 hypothetical protein CNMCM8694_009290 [Aspergillus lentulus]KAF4205084.1 hypothetical protein CNMCM8927_006598 [Aspergillus lentulus]
MFQNSNSRPMSARYRQKACIACAKSKRRCDKQLPECQRCLDKDVECEYPEPKRRRRNPIVGDNQAEEFPTDPDALRSYLTDFEDWGAISGAADLNFPLSDVMVPFVPPLSIPANSVQAQDAALPRADIVSTQCPWFLRDETWTMRHSNEEPACKTGIQLEPFIRAVEEMLRSWVRNGYNSFIHRRLYEYCMPTCVQDAFTTLAAYAGCTPAVKETVLQIVEERLSVLVRQSPPTDSHAHGILDHLGRVHALFIYEFIALFDGSVRLRATAEKHIPTLRQWVTQMWEAAKSNRGEDCPWDNPPLQWTASEFDKEYDVCSAMWRQWVLTESVRRSRLIIDTVMNVYETTTKGWADCTGSVMFTSRRGLWDAESAIKWFELCSLKPPLLVDSLQPGALMSQYSAEELDDLAKLYWTYIVGADKIQCWIDRTSIAAGRP